MSTIYITGDIHGENDIFRLSSKRFPEGKLLTKDDFVIIAGDFGVLWNNMPDNNERYLIKWLNDKPWTTLFIDGNHENFDRLNSLPLESKFNGTVGCVSESIYHLKRGEIYTINDKTFFCFGGAHSWDREYRTLGLSFWEEEVPNYEEMDYGLSNLEKHDYNIDYIITHTMPKSLIQIVGFSKAPDGKEDPTTKYLDHIANSATYKKWYFGHMHIDLDFGKFRALYGDIISLDQT